MLAVELQFSYSVFCRFCKVRCALSVVEGSGRLRSVGVLIVACKAKWSGIEESNWAAYCWPGFSGAFTRFRRVTG